MHSCDMETAKQFFDPFEGVYDIVGFFFSPDDIYNIQLDSIQPR